MSVQSVWTAGWSLPREILSHVSRRDECLYSQCEQQDGVCLVRYYPMNNRAWWMSVQSVRIAWWSLPREILSHVSGRDECLYSQCEQQDGVCLVRYYPMSLRAWWMSVQSVWTAGWSLPREILSHVRAWGLQPCTGRALLRHKHVRINTPFSPVILPPLLLLIVTDAKDHVDDVCLWFLSMDWPSPSSPTEILSALIRQTYNTSFPRYSHVFRSVLLSSSISSLCWLPVLSCV